MQVINPYCQKPTVNCPQLIASRLDELYRFIFFPIQYTASNILCVLGVRFVFLSYSRIVSICFFL